MTYEDWVQELVHRGDRPRMLRLGQRVGLARRQALAHVLEKIKEKLTNARSRNENEPDNNRPSGE